MNTQSQFNGPLTQASSHASTPGLNVAKPVEDLEIVPAGRKTISTSRNKTAGFTMTEIMIAVVVIGILAGLYAMYAPGVFRTIRVNSAANDVQSLTASVVHAGQALGGTLPITEGGASLPTITGTNCAASTAANFYNNARLEQVLEAVPNATCTKYYTPSIGSQVFQRADGATGAATDLTYNPTTGAWSSVGTDTTVTATMSYAAVTRLECAAVTTNVPGTDGTNYKINGSTNLSANRVAYVVYEGVNGTEAYQLAQKLDGQTLITDTAGNGTVAQTAGICVYAASATGTNTVYVELGAF